MTIDAVGGVWPYGLDLARGLARIGVETIAAVLGPAPNKDQRGAAAAAGLTLIETGLPLDWTAPDPRSLRESGRRLADLAAANDADLVHLNTAALAADSDYAAPVLVMHHSCVATWWAAVRRGPLPADFGWRTELVGQGLRTAAAALAPSAAFASMTAAIYALPELPTVVHNGRSLARSGKPEIPPDAETGPAIFTAGRLWDEGKNIALLDAAAAELDATVWAAGPQTGPNGARVDFRHLTMTGNLSDDGVRALLDRRPIYVSTALYEPFGLAVLEAAQVGCPLVLSDIATFRELWDDAAVFTPVGDGEALTRTLAALLADPRRRDRLGRAAKKRAADYSVDAMLAGTLAAYRSLTTESVRVEAVA